MRRARVFCCLFQVRHSSTQIREGKKMRSRRMSVIVASVAVPVLMLAATSCSSGDKSSSTNAIADTTATLGKYAITNNVDPCWLALRSITDLLNDNPRKGKRQAFPVSVAPVEPNGERRCVRTPSGSTTSSCCRRSP